jgi:hypothetical protein
MMEKVKYKSLTPKLRNSNNTGDIEKDRQSFYVGLFSIIEVMVLQVTLTLNVAWLVPLQ